MEKAELYPEKVCIIILNWNGKKDTIECLESLKMVEYPNYEIILVDNGSTDGSVESLRKLYPDMEIIENLNNLGFAAGNNVGIRKAIEKGADYVLLLNNDTTVNKDFLNNLITVAKNDDMIGIAGPIIRYYSEPENSWFEKGKINWFSFNIATHTKITDDKEVVSTDFMTGCAFLIKKATIEKVGFLTDEYFFYFEDVDYSLRAKNAGFKIVVTPLSKIYHKVSATASKKFKPESLYYANRNRFWIIKTYCPLKYKPIVYLLVTARTLIAIGYHISRKDKQCALAVMKAYKEVIQRSC
jgi:GT2 family glycosyltransferase